MRFLLPPSPSHAVADKNAALLQQFLRSFAIDVEIGVAADYSALGSALVTGAAELAWAPPIVCARVEICGGAVLLRCVRDGASTYGAQLVARRGAAIDLAHLSSLRAAWVDEDSAAGFELARSHFAGRHVDIYQAFASMRFYGSYERALAAVADGEADIASMYVSRTRSALDDVSPAVAARLEPIYHLGVTHTDGVVRASHADHGASMRVAQALLTLAGTGDGLLRDVLFCDGLSTPSPTIAASAPLSTFQRAA